MGIWARLAAYVGAAEAMRSFGRWLLGALLWGCFVTLLAAPMVAAYLCGRAAQ